MSWRSSSLQPWSRGRCVGQGAGQGAGQGVGQGAGQGVGQGGPLWTAATTLPPFLPLLPVCQVSGILWAAATLDFPLEESLMAVLMQV